MVYFPLLCENNYPLPQKSKLDWGGELEWKDHPSSKILKFLSDGINPETTFMSPDSVQVKQEETEMDGLADETSMDGMADVEHAITLDSQEPEDRTDPVSS